MRSFWNIWVGPKANEKCLYERQKGETQKEEEMANQRRIRDWSDAATSPGMPAATRNWKGQGRIHL